MKNTKRMPAFSSELADILEFNEFVNKFRRIRRLMYYKGVRGRERNGEHCFHLLFLAWYVIHRLDLTLDLFKVLLMVVVHDLPEVHAGDTPVVPDHLEGKYGPSRATKKEREALAIEQLEREWGVKFPPLIQAVHEYEELKCPESRFVCALDKFATESSIFQDNGRIDKEVGMTLTEKIEKKRHRVALFPPLLALFDELYEVWEHHHDKQFFTNTKLATKEAAE